MRFRVLLLCFVVLFLVPTVGATPTGGSITTDGAYTIHTFTSNGTFVYDMNLNVSYLVVAGGGSGGLSVGGYSYGRATGGGGAGGYLVGTDYHIIPQNYTITVGSGGDDSNGGNSVFDTFTAIGGGAGGIAGNAGLNGGSGGGAGRNSNVVGVGTSGQGQDGGIGAADASTSSGAGGGGGANVSGAGGTVSIGGNGGTGFFSSISGTLTYYAGGGGGARIAGNGGTGGLGGGGAGASADVSRGVNGAANSGGGGGGSGTTQAADQPGGLGGSGVVVIRYLSVLNPDINTTLTTPIDIYTNSNNLTFNIVGNFTSANATLFIDSTNKWNGSITTGQNTAYNITLTEGLHSWYINATATASGNTTSNISATENFYYDISDPTVATANINPSYSIISEGSIVKTNLSWSDNLQLKNASFYVNTGSGYSETANTTLSGTSDWFNTSIDTAGLTGHSVSWYQIAYDQAGNSYTYSGSFDVVLGALSIYIFDETTGDPVLPSDVRVYNDDVSRTATINGSTNISTINYDGFTSGKYIVSVIADDYYTRRSIILIDIETLSSLNIYLPSTNETTIFDQFVLVDNTLMYELSECIIRLDKPLPNGTDTVYSSYFDFDGVASTYLIATDQYILYIETPDSVISYGWLTPDADGLINIVITDPITDLLDDWLSYAIIKSDTGSISLNYESDIDIDTASFYLNTSAGDVLYTASISTDSGSFTYSADINESYYLSFTATSQSGETKTVTRFIFWNEGGVQPERLPLLPDGAPDWFYNLLSVGVIIICIMLFSQVRADAACIIGAAFSGLFWYWGWLKISGIVIAVIALIAIAAVMYKSKREGI
ncbi:MAG: hypothetical protein KAW93_06425 [Methanogenium sp.]|nr:hypothetical protein [Methanogenium sp.]